ncbi:MAG: bifunctional phosphopantothenoylcysteine decarboxylase/phosphopantothenate--cysteine ligase CoaBC [Crocinitomicaceae bacterium]|tara:strand:- start:6469 stop:7665 length:1197 start_codon:yes stop_codon:yes gene_type:complete
MFGKRILLGITGGIAAYKIAYLIRILKKLGAEVKCIMTPASSAFISPLVVSTLSKNEVGIEFWDKNTGTWNNHVAYAEWADVFLVAPATMNTIGKMANGLCDNLLLATYFSMKCKTIVAPAMDLDMYKHPSFLRNIATLSKDGVMVIPAEEGELASGLEGEGRLAEPEVMVSFLTTYMASEVSLCGKRICITAGPTQEAIDPVRYISNHSSGKMGFSIAKAALIRGYEVVLICGPTQETLVHPLLKRIDVLSAKEMLKEVQSVWQSCDFGVFSAAVADFRPVNVSEFKMKKNDDLTSIQLEQNPDILKWASFERKNNQKVIGFALETNNEEENALLKLEQKNLDLIVLNSTQDKGATFGGEQNKVTIFGKTGKLVELELQDKFDIAVRLMDIIEDVNA